MAASLFTAAHRELVRAVVAMRKNAGFTQRDLAQALGREHNYVARIETAQRRVDLVELITICRACGADPEAEILKLLRSMPPVLSGRQRR
jgi:transcriptional regulator with XRE-family HTH domain